MDRVHRRQVLVHPVWIGLSALATADDGLAEAEGYLDSYAVGVGAMGAAHRSLDLRAPSALAWQVRYGCFVGRNAEWEVAYVGAAGVALVETGLALHAIGRARVHPTFGAGLGTGQVGGAWTVTTPAFAGLLLDLGNVAVGTRLTGRPTTSGGGHTWTATVDLVSRY